MAEPCSIEGRRLNNGPRPSQRGSRHSNNVCWPCRQRKVGCDGKRNSCTNCVRLNFPCSYTQGGAECSTAPALLPRRRGRQACAACRRRKIRCSGEEPSCSRCSRKAIRCEYLNSTSHESANQPAPLVSTPASPLPSPHRVDQDIFESGLLPSPDSPNTICNPLTSKSNLAARCLEAFFSRAWPLPVFSFLHRPTIMEQHRHGRLDRALFLAIAGIATLIVDLGPGTRAQGADAIDLAESLVIGNLDKPTLYSIQAIVLITQHRLMSRKFVKVFMLASLAARSALALRLNYEHPGAPFLTRESCRRTVWALYMMDTTLAAGYMDFTLWRPELINIQLPCEDQSFLMDTPQKLPRLNHVEDCLDAPTDPLGLMAYTIRILHLRHRVLVFTKEAAASIPAPSGDVEDRVRYFETELQRFLHEVPTHIQPSKYALHLHAHLPTIAPYLKIHITWFGVSCILYRLAFVDLQEGMTASARAWLDSEFLLDCQRRCFKSASSMVDFFNSVLGLGIASVCLDTDIAVIAYQCARLLICVHKSGVMDVSVGDTTAKLTQCRDFVNSPLFCPCDAINAIRDDLMKLVSEYLDTSIPPETDTSAAEATATTRSTHILSKHSFVRQMNIGEGLQYASLDDLHRRPTQIGDGTFKHLTELGSDTGSALLPVSFQDEFISSVSPGFEEAATGDYSFQLLDTEQLYIEDRFIF